MRIAVGLILLFILRGIAAATMTPPIAGASVEVFARVVSDGGPVAVWVDPGAATITTCEAFAFGRQAAPCEVAGAVATVPGGTAPGSVVLVTVIALVRAGPPTLRASVQAGADITSLSAPITYQVALPVIRSGP